MNDSIPKARTVWKDSFGDIQLYSDNTLEVTIRYELNFSPVIDKLAISALKFVCGRSCQQFRHSRVMVAMGAR